MPCIFKDCLNTEEMVDFPRGVKQFEAWKKFVIKYEPLFLNIPNYKIRKYYKMCLEHFEDKYLKNLTIFPRELIPRAIPTIPPKDPPDILSKPKISSFQIYLQKLQMPNKYPRITTPVFEHFIQKAMNSITRVNKNCLLLIDFLPLRDENMIAIVFMVRGLYENYKQLLSYSIEHTSINMIELAVLITDAINTTKYLKFRVLGLMCPFDLKMMDALNLISNYESRSKSDNPEQYEYISFDGRRLLILFCPCQLLTALHLEFMHMDLKYKIDNNYVIASSNDVVLAYKEQKLNKNQVVTDEHVYYNKSSMFSVRHAAQYFSNSLADSLLEYKEDHAEKFLPTIEDTARLLRLFNDLFDSLNGYKSSSPPHKTLYNKVTLKSTHALFWKQAADTIKNSSFLRCNGQEIKSPVLDKWFLTLHGFVKLWQLLECQRFINFTPRRVNLNPLQNDLARLRYYSLRNIKNLSAEYKRSYYPNIDEFREAFKFYMEEGTNYLSPAGTTFSNKMHNERTDLDFEKYQDETIFNCLPDYCSTILTHVDFDDSYFEKISIQLNHGSVKKDSLNVQEPKH